MKKIVFLSLYLLIFTTANAEVVIKNFLTKDYKAAKSSMTKLHFESKSTKLGFITMFITLGPFNIWFIILKFNIEFIICSIRVYNINLRVYY